MLHSQAEDLLVYLFLCKQQDRQPTTVPFIIYNALAAATCDYIGPAS